MTRLAVQPLKRRCLPNPHPDGHKIAPSTDYGESEPPPIKQTAVHTARTGVGCVLPTTAEARGIFLVPSFLVLKQVERPRVLQTFTWTITNCSCESSTRPGQLSNDQAINRLSSTSCYEVDRSSCIQPTTRECCCPGHKLVATRALVSCHVLAFG